VEEQEFENELNYLLDLYEIEPIEKPKKTRDEAIHVLLTFKKKEAIKLKKKIIEDKYIINEYNKKGMEGIKKLFNRNVCYLYNTDFVYNVLFYHYKNNWEIVEKIIKDYDK
tara:strand:- start:2279 stop:2611 length:333 start_codon:yes stop_codon:yes gene_type:complete